MGTIATITNELESLKSYIESTIAHIKSGVGNLNEDQTDKAVEMISLLPELAQQAKDRSLESLNDTSVAERYEFFMNHKPSIVSNPAEPDARDVVQPALHIQEKAADKSKENQELKDAGVVIDPGLNLTQASQFNQNKSEETEGIDPFAEANPYKEAPGSGFDRYGVSDWTQSEQLEDGWPTGVPLN